MRWVRKHVKLRPVTAMVTLVLLVLPAVAKAFS